MDKNIELRVHYANKDQGFGVNFKKEDCNNGVGEKDDSKCFFIVYFKNGNIYAYTPQFYDCGEQYYGPYSSREGEENKKLREVLEFNDDQIHEFERWNYKNLRENAFFISNSMSINFLFDISHQVNKNKMIRLYKDYIENVKKYLEEKKMFDKLDNLKKYNFYYKKECYLEFYVDRNAKKELIEKVFI